MAGWHKAEPDGECVRLHGSKAIRFGGSRDGNLVFESILPLLYDYAPLRPDLLSVRPTRTGGIQLEWTESGFGYVVEETEELPSGWSPVETVRGRSRWSSPPVLPTGASRFLRIRTID